MVLSCVTPPGLTLPMIPNFQVKPQYLANNVGDVGVTLMTLSGGRVTGFSLIFPFENFQDAKFVDHVKCIPRAFLLGRITNQLGLECINKVAATKNSDRHGFKFDLRFL